MPKFRLSCALLLLSFPGVLAAQSGDLLTHVWNGVQQAQNKATTACGTITETRTSVLLVKPLVLRGKFCARVCRDSCWSISRPMQCAFASMKTI